MKAPIPKTEIAIVQRRDNAPRLTFVEFVVATDDAASWITEQAPKFGELDVLSARHFHYFVYHALYNPDEVVDFIVSLGRGEDGDAVDDTAKG